VLVAPETDGLLAKLTRSIANAGGRSIGSSPEAVELTTDKARLAEHFEAGGIPTPPTLIFDTSIGLPKECKGTVVIKPIDGAGSLDTFVVRDTRSLPTVLEPARKMLVQPYLPGIPSSASFLVDRDGRARLVGVGRQRIEVDGEGRVEYHGGTIGGSIAGDLSAVEQAVHSVPGLRGFVGVDFLDDLDSGPTVLEINPRPTTSYVGLSRMFPPGTIAGAWLDAERRLAAADWPDRFRRSRRAATVTFRADGTIESEEPFS
jgi:predicted ATP-grasp superfamily ATP-dependent carboligase